MCVNQQMCSKLEINTSLHTHTHTHTRIYIHIARKMYNVISSTSISSIFDPNVNVVLKSNTMIFFYGWAALVGPGLLIVEVSRSNSFRHTTPGRTPLNERLARHTQQSQETDIHFPSRI